VNSGLVRSLLGRLLVLLGVLTLLPLGVALFYRDGAAFREVQAYLWTIALTTMGGAALRWKVDDDFGHIGRRDGFLLVTLSWVCLALVGGLPFALAEGVFLIDGEPAPGLLSTFSNPGGLALAWDVYTHAVFEAISGFTTTGATVLTDIERLPHSLLFWRALTHWLGGMGIVLLGIAILPSLGAGGYQLARAEVPGPTTDKLRPRIAETARLLWSVYLLLTVTETLALMVCGMTFFDALCHTFATLATGGFSTRNASIAAYASPAVQWTIVLFMFLAGVNFLLHFQALRGRSLRGYLRDPEWRMYAGLIAVASLTLAAPLIRAGAGIEPALRDATFSVVSIITTTGFCTADFDTWGNAARLSLVLLMFFGGCAGSTGGGLKQVRLMVVAKIFVRELKRLTRPSAIFSIKLDQKAVPEDTVAGILALFCLYIALFVAGALGMAMILDMPGVSASYQLETAVTASVACIGNIGPGLAGVGATQNYQFIPIAGKWLLVFLMLLGRLEVYSVMVLLLPDTWRR
jgi:trk system potassium uptake protein TrkH